MDKDLIQNAELIDFEFTRTLEDTLKWILITEDTLKWILININCMIETRKEDLDKKKPGALSTMSEPRLIGVQMVRRLKFAQTRIFSIANKFKHILEEVIAGDQGSYILKLHLDRTYASILTGLEISCQMIKLSFGELLMPA